MNNTVILIGNVGKEKHIEYREFDRTGKALLKFTMATTDRMKKGDGTVTRELDWHIIECWNNVATSIHKYLSEGDKIIVHGSVKYNKFTTGTTTHKTAVVRAKIINIISKREELIDEED